MIDEKKPIKEIEKRINFWKDRAATEESEFGAKLKMVMAAEATKILDMVNNQPKVGEWIPCSERPPEYTSNYLVTVMIGSPFGAYKEVRSAIYNTKTGWCVYKSADEIANVIAWAESPKPWEGEEDESGIR